jgi:chromosome segregation ATPase
MSLFQTNTVINNIYLKGSRKLEPEELKVVEDIKKRMEDIEKKYLPKRKTLNSESYISYEKGQQADRDVVELSKELAKVESQVTIAYKEYRDKKDQLDGLEEKQNKAIEKTKELYSKINSLKAESKKHYESYKKSIEEGTKLAAALKGELGEFLPVLKQYGVTIDTARAS